MVLRRRRSRDAATAIDVGAAPLRFRPIVADALVVRARYADVVARLRPGPLQERMTAMAARIDAGVEAIWQSALQAGRMEAAVEQLQPQRTAEQLKQARRRAAEAGEGDDEMIDALAARFASTQRLLNAIDDTDRTLRLLDARLGAAVARAAEIELLGGSTHEVDALAAQLDDVVTELGALQSALGVIDAVG